MFLALFGGKRPGGDGQTEVNVISVALPKGACVVDAASMYVLVTRCEDQRRCETLHRMNDE